VKLRQILAFCALCAAGCGGGSVTVTPAGPAIEDNFFATWEIQSQSFGPVSCEEVGVASVDMDIVNVDTNRRFVYSFDCRDYQGTSGPVDVGSFDVLLSLTDFNGVVLSQTDVGTENVSVAGTIDLGHHIFLVP
jgi:hypothetical protein